MIWALLEITIPLCLSFLFGIGAGWLLWRWRRRQITATEWNSHSTQTESADVSVLQGQLKKVLAEREDMVNKVAALEAKKADTNQAASSAMNFAKPTAAAVNPAEVSALKSQLDTIGKKNVALKAKVAEVTNNSEQLTKSHNELQQKLKQSETVSTDRDAAIGKIKQLEEQLAQSNAAADELVQTKAQLATLDQKFKNFQSSVVANRQTTDNEKEKLQTRAADLEAKLNAEKQRNASSENTNNNDAKLAEMELQLQQADRAEKELLAARQNIANLNVHLKEARQKIAQADIARANPAASNNNQKITELTQKNNELSRQLQLARNANTTNAQTAPVKAPVTSINVRQVQKLQAEVAAKQARIEELEKKTKSKSNKKASKKPVKNKTSKAKKSNDWRKGETKLGTPGSDHKDDLKEINGIGPKIENVLNRLGIKSWEQLATLKVAEIKKVDEALKDFSGRIQRDEWVPQAKEIMRNGHQPLKAGAKASAPKKAKKTDKKNSKKSTKKAKKPTKNAWQTGTTRFGTPGSAHKDDLKVINGIGPVIEKSLNRYGVKSWEQLATLKAKDVKTIDEALAFPGRIAREQWIAQAKDLVKKYPDPKDRPTRRTFLNPVAAAR